MFTGLVEEVGHIGDVRTTDGGRRLGVAAHRVLEGMAVGDSVAVDGACLTVVAFGEAGFDIDVIGPTLERTTLGLRRSGDAVNLERALPLGARLGGHLVQGHVDGVGTVAAVVHAGDNVLLDIDVPDLVADVAVPHGSIAINGVSLTISRLPADLRVQVALIPYTREHTNLRHLTVGDRVNVEGDMLGRFVVRYLERRGAGRGRRPGGTGR
jgi:riboflavin synthase